jgi:hypothetical protein
MDITESNPPANPIAMAAIQTDSSRTKGAKDRPKGGGAGKDGGKKATNWKYLAPKTGKSETKTHSKPNGSKEKQMWCGHAECKRWTPSHTTSGHGKREGKSTTQKAP